MLLEAEEEGIKMVVPGSKCLDVEKLMYDFMKSKGYERKFSTHQFSHDVDVAFPKARVTFKPGMTWSIHPCAFVPGVGGGFINDLCLVTSGKPELFFKSPRKLVQI